MALLLLPMQGKAQEFYNLTAQEVRIDSVLPVFTYHKPLGYHYADSIYTIGIEYPEFTDMSAAEVRLYKQLGGEEPGELPEISRHIGVERKQGVLDVSFCPVVKRDGKYRKLVSFKLNVRAEAKAVMARTRADESPAGRYAEHSVLQSGTWAKIRVSKSGIH